MLDNLYHNIGGKIKNWAKWIFIFEAIGAIIAGIVLIFTDEDFILYGLITLICGPIIAWVSSWILYAFGELVEDVHFIRNKEERTVVDNKLNTVAPKVYKSNPNNKTTHPITVVPSNTGYKCPVCKMSMDSLVPCERCGYVPPQDA